MMAPKQRSEPIGNRSEPIPIVSVTGPDAPSSSVSSGVETPTTPGRRARLKEKLGSIGERFGLPESPSNVSDRMFTMLLNQVLPTEDPNDESTPKDRRSREYAGGDRPNFSLPVMSSNFRRFNARIGVAFIFQNRMIRLFTWRKPSQTTAFLFVYSFVCLNPPLLAVLPLAACLFFIMVPAFLARHPPPPSYQPTDLYPLAGPPLAPAPNVRPTPELSRDFFRNMRDLQNCMEDFSRAHDALIAFLAPPTNFSNEALSSILYLILMCTACLLFITAHLLPWRFIFLFLGHAATLSGHPAVRSLITTTHTDEVLRDGETKSRSFLLRLSRSDIVLSATPEVREVEIFELQHRALHNTDGEFGPYLFSSSSYVPLSPSRIAGERPKGTPFFEDVKPPRGWRWSDKKWTLDLLSREWVEETCVTGVEVEIEGERWVTDLLYEKGAESEWEKRGNGGEKVEGKREGSGLTRAWEEARGESRKGEWRRRRWVRGVERIPVTDDQ
ncbi:Pex24p-domain-containing protein [Delitschia confertaspora ATCC 74209]|uniref:Pex24p-domain-containing protein n=1 Tax=Delitschia confertaspora ATCC 74209 TaxID=1513339 RepID=A0A9P4JK17_9PLEO|nr:Pex24p-domain-containing protein [Delitschia confertaspora ATCC 74209]